MIESAEASQKSPLPDVGGGRLEVSKMTVLVWLQEDKCMNTANATALTTEDWRRFCPELVKLEKSLGLADPVNKTVVPPDNAAVCLNRWGHPDAHTLKWMEDQAISRLRIDEEFARVPTEESGRSALTTPSVQKQVCDDDFVLDQGFSTGQTDRLLREQDRRLIEKANSAAAISVESECLRRDSRSEVNGPLDMGFLAVSDLSE